MPSNTVYKPTKTSDFEASKLNFNAQGVSATATAGTSTNVDYLLADDCLITGVWVISDGNVTIGDYVHFQVVDVSGAFTGTPNTVINQFVTNWFVPTPIDVQLDMIYPAKIYAGLTLRLVYHSTGSSAVLLGINYKLHKVLI